MKKTALILSTLLCVSVVGTFAADEEKKKAKKKAPASLADQTLKKYEAAGLTDEQTAKVRELAGAADAKIKEAKTAAALTDEQKKAQKAAMEAAKAAGKEKKELRDAAKAAVTLSEAQLAAQKQVKTAMGEFGKTVRGLLTKEQLAKMKAAAPPRKKKGAPAKPADS